jgi:hypothetical protein
MHPSRSAAWSLVPLVPLFPLVLGLGSCDTGPPGGTFVGNPGEMAVRLTGGEQDWAVRVVMEVSALELEGCGGEQQLVPVSESIDLLGGGATLPLPDGEWCVIQLRVEGLHLDATELGLEPIPLELPVDRVVLYAASEVVIGGRAFVLELGDGGWVELVILGLLTNGSTSFGPGDALLDGLMEEIASSSLLFLDLDRDGYINVEERALGPLAASR